MDTNSIEKMKKKKIGILRVDKLHSQMFNLIKKIHKYQFVRSSTRAMRPYKYIYLYPPFFIDLKFVCILFWILLNHIIIPLHSKFLPFLCGKLLIKLRP